MKSVARIVAEALFYLAVAGALLALHFDELKTRTVSSPTKFIYQDF